MNESHYFSRQPHHGSKPVVGRPTTKDKTFSHIHVAHIHQEMHAARYNNNNKTTNTTTAAGDDAILPAVAIQKVVAAGRFVVL